MENVYLVAVILYAIFWIIRFKTGNRIWNIFGVGMLIFLTLSFSQYIPILITLIGLIIYQLYDALLGG